MLLLLMLLSRCHLNSACTGRNDERSMCSSLLEKK
jgi:hypothetical protein